MYETSPLTISFCKEQKCLIVCCKIKLNYLTTNFRTYAHVRCHAVAGCGDSCRCSCRRVAGDCRFQDQEIGTWKPCASDGCHRCVHIRSADGQLRHPRHRIERSYCRRCAACGASRAVGRISDFGFGAYNPVSDIRRWRTDGYRM